MSNSMYNPMIYCYMNQRSKEITFQSFFIFLNFYIIDLGKDLSKFGKSSHVALRETMIKNLSKILKIRLVSVMYFTTDQCRCISTWELCFSFRMNSQWAPVLQQRGNLMEADTVQIRRLTIFSIQTSSMVNNQVGALHSILVFYARYFVLGPTKTFSSPVLNLPSEVYPSISS